MSDPIRFGTYNIVPRPFKDSQIHSWENRKDAVIQTINQNCDLVGIQEFDTHTPFHMTDHIEQALLNQKEWEAYLPGKDTSLGFTDVFHHRLPIFWKTKMFTLVNKGQFQLSGWHQQEAHITPIVENRYCSWVQLIHNPTNTTWYVYNLHQQHHTLNASTPEISMAYRKQTDGLNNLLKHITTLPENANIVVLGDFNNPTIPTWFLNQACLEEAATQTQLNQRHNLEYNSYHNWERPQPKNSSHIDHILVSKNINIASTTMVLDETGSDHYLLRTCILP